MTWRASPASAARPRDGKIDAAFRSAAGALTRPTPRPARRRQRGALSDELWRGHHRRVFVHQFRVISTRQASGPPRTPFVSPPAYDYRTRFGSPPLGLAAAKHAEALQARERAVEDARFNGQVLARHHARPIENKVSTVGRLSPKELRHRASAEFIAGLKLQQQTLHELCEFHRRNGTLEAFLESLKYG